MRDDADDADAIPKGVVIDTDFDWEDDRPPATPWHETVIYEMHVKGFTKLHPDVPEDLRGTYAGLASDAGDRAPDARSASPPSSCCRSTTSPTSGTWSTRGLTNYWGYNTIGFFAPHAQYAGDRAPGEQVREFKEMVKALHARRHRGDPRRGLQPHRRGQPPGPDALAARHRQRRRTTAARPRTRATTWTTRAAATRSTCCTRTCCSSSWTACATGCWRCTSTASASTSPSTLARELHDVDRLGGLLRHHPPGPGALAGQADRRAVGRRRGRLPGRQLPGAVDGVERQLSRRGARLLERRQADGVSSFALAADRLERPLRGGRPPARRAASTSSPRTTASRCATSSRYNEKHNEANGEDNRDGTDDNRSWNCGVEGPTDDPAINALRERQQRNFLATLFLSQGVPMLLGGDEIGRTQGGNNNAYCQDNEISLVRLGARRAPGALLDFTRAADRAAARAPGVPAARLPRRRVAERRRAARLVVVPARRARDDAQGLGAARTRRALGVFLNGEELRGRDAAGEPVVDDSFLILFNAHHEPASSRCRRGASAARWEVRALDRRARGADGRREARARRDVTARVALAASLLQRAGARGLSRARPTGSSSGRRSRLRGGARARAVPARPRRQPPLPLARRCRPARARRTATTSSTRAGSPTSWAARPGFARAGAAPASASCSTSSPTTWRRPTRTPSGATRSCASGSSTSTRAPAGTGVSSTIDELAGVRVEEPEVFEVTARASVLELVDGGPRRRAAHRPSGRARRPARLPRAARDARRRAHLGREDPRAGRAAARLAGRGHDGLRRS